MISFDKIDKKTGYCAAWDSEPLTELGRISNHAIPWVEFALNHPQWFPDKIKSATLKQIKKDARNSGINLCFLAPNDLDFLSLHHNIHQAVISRAIEFIELANELNASFITFSLPPVRMIRINDRPHPITEFHPQMVEDSLARTLHLLYAFAEPTPVCLSDPQQSLADPVIRNTVSASLQKEEIFLSAAANSLADSSADTRNFYLTHIGKIKVIKFLSEPEPQILADLRNNYPEIDPDLILLAATPPEFAAQLSLLR